MRPRNDPIQRTVERGAWSVRRGAGDPGAASSSSRPVPHAPRLTPHAVGAGYTLIEIMMVVAILAIVAAIVIPQAVEGSDLQALSAARTVVSDLEYARDLSISLAQPITVAFDTAAESYRLTNASQDIVHPITKAPAYVVDFLHTPGLTRANLVTASFGGVPSVTFDETGAPSSSGTVTVQLGSHLYTLTVAAATGKVSVSGS